MKKIKKLKKNSKNKKSQKMVWIWNGRTKKMIYNHLDERKKIKKQKRILKVLEKIIKMFKMIFLVILKDFYFLDADSPKDDCINLYFMI